MRNIRYKQLKSVVVTCFLTFVTPYSISNSWGSTNGYIQDLTKTIGNNFTLAVDITNTSETDALDKVALEEEKKCAAGEEGTQGAAINEAMQIHIEFGSAQPDVEQLFEINSDCFSKLNKLYDLSYSIPSLSSIINAAQDAVIEYSKQKVCTAIFESSKIVTDPINKAIDKINTKYSKYLDLNGITNGAIQNQLSKLDPNLGRDYMGAKTNTEYTIMPFSKNQTTFENSSNVSQNNIDSAEKNSSSGYNNQINQISSLNSKLQSEQMKIPAAQNNLSSAQNLYNRCLSQSVNNCADYKQKLDQASINLNNIQTNIQNYQNQLSMLSSNKNFNNELLNNRAISIESSNQSKLNQNAQQSKNENATSYFNSISKIFN